MTGGGVSPPMGLSPPGSAEGTGDVPEVPGVIPVDTGACADPGVLGAAVGSWEPAALDTAVAMDSAAAGRSGSGTLGILGRTGGLAAWCCSVGWRPCWPAGAPDGVLLADLAELVLGEDGVPDGPLPATRLDKVGFTACVGAMGALGVPGVLGDSGVGALALGISGSFCGSGAGAPGVPV